jgi:hypothetical protein
MASIRLFRADVETCRGRADMKSSSHIWAIPTGSSRVTAVENACATLTSSLMLWMHRVLCRNPMMISLMQAGPVAVIRSASVAPDEAALSFDWSLHRSSNPQHESLVKQPTVIRESPCR